MNQYGYVQPGDGLNRVESVVGNIIRVRGADRPFGFINGDPIRGPDGQIILVDTLDGPSQFEDTLTYDIQVEIGEGATVFEKVKPHNPPWARPLKVTAPLVGDIVFGFRVGSQFFLLIFPKPSYGPCEVPANLSVISSTITTKPAPLATAPTEHQAPEEPAYDPSKDPFISPPVTATTLVPFGKPQAISGTATEGP